MVKLLSILSVETIKPVSLLIWADIVDRTEFMSSSPCRREDGIMLSKHL